MTYQTYVLGNGYSKPKPKHWHKKHHKQEQPWYSRLPIFWILAGAAVGVALLLGATSAGPSVFQQGFWTAASKTGTSEHLAGLPFGDARCVAEGKAVMEKAERILHAIEDAQADALWNPDGTTGSAFAQKMRALGEEEQALKRWTIELERQCDYQTLPWLNR